MASAPLPCLHSVQLGHSYIGTEHLLLGIIREGKGVAAQVLTKLGVDLEAARQGVEAIMSGRPAGPPLTHPAAGTAGQSARMGRTTSEPRCPQCRVGLSEGARFRTMQVQPDDNEGEKSPLQTMVVYCGACGVSLHMFTGSS